MPSSFRPERRQNGCLTVCAGERVTATGERVTATWPTSITYLIQPCLHHSKIPHLHTTTMGEKGALIHDPVALSALLHRAMEANGASSINSSNGPGMLPTTALPVIIKHTKHLQYEAANPSNWQSSKSATLQPVPIHQVSSPSHNR